MTPNEMKKQMLAELTKRHEALTQEWDKVKDDASATPPSGSLSSPTSTPRLPSSGRSRR